MNAFTLFIQGKLKPLALRHHIFKMGNALGIRGYLNYRNDMSELYIHAEGEEEIMLDFTNQVNQLVREHKLMYTIVSVTSKGYVDFKISNLEDSLNHNFEDSDNIPKPDSIILPFTETQETEQNHITIKNNNQVSVIGGLFSFIKHAGL